MNEAVKLQKLKNEYRIVLMEYEVATETIEKNYRSKLSKIENKIWEMERIL